MVSSASTSDNETTTNSMQQDEGNATGISPQNFFYLNKEAATQLPQFQYRGQDLSLMYHYLLSPLASFCVNQLTPQWVAPNTITLTGLVFMITAYLAVWFYVPTLEISSDEEDQIPRWIFFWNGVAMLLYQTLDNMDGKQARKTKSSSPLGLLFDHGADSINPIFGSANWIVGMMLSPSRDLWLCFAAIFGPQALFFMATWEEYYTGELIMPIFNGPNEGLAGGATLSFLSAWYGPSIWQQTTLWNDYVVPVIESILFPNTIDEWIPRDLRHSDMLMLFASFCMIKEPALKITFVAKKYGVSAIYNLLPFAALITCVLTIGYKDSDIWLSVPRTSLHLFAVLFVDMTTELQLRHMTGERYEWRRWMLFPLILFAGTVSLADLKSSRMTDDFLLAYSSVCIGFMLLKIVIVIHEVSTVLNLWCFDIVTPRTAMTHAKVS